jgi:hypothetical protein
MRHVLVGSYTLVTNYKSEYHGLMPKIFFSSVARLMPVPDASLSRYLAIPTVIILLQGIHTY